MEEQEPPMEPVHEELHHHAEHAEQRWVPGVALSAAILAALAAVASLLSGHHANEAMLDQLRASDQWSFYQAKSIKSAVLSSKLEMLSALGKERSEKDAANVERYEKEKEQIQEKAKEESKASEAHLAKHLVLARSVTLFQIAIAIAAISVLTKQKPFWFVGLAFGAVGLGFLLWGAFVTA